MFEISKEFTFEAAHHLGANVKEGHYYSRLHGHSFTVEVYVRGEPDPTTQWVADFGELDRALDEVKSEIDHRYLNEMDGLEIPTLENISRWIWNRLHNTLPGVSRVVVKRPTCGQGCTYSMAA